MNITKKMEVLDMTESYRQLGLSIIMVEKDQQLSNELTEQLGVQLKDLIQCQQTLEDVPTARLNSKKDVSVIGMVKNSVSDTFWKAFPPEGTPDTYIGGIHMEKVVSSLKVLSDTRYNTVKMINNLNDLFEKMEITGEYTKIEIDSAKNSFNKTWNSVASAPLVELIITLQKDAEKADRNPLFRNISPMRDLLRSSDEVVSKTGDALDYIHESKEKLVIEIPKLISHIQHDLAELKEDTAPQPTKRKMW